MLYLSLSTYNCVPANFPLSNYYYIYLKCEANSSGNNIAKYTASFLPHFSMLTLRYFYISFAQKWPTRK